MAEQQPTNPAAADLANIAANTAQMKALISSFLGEVRVRWQRTEPTAGENEIIKRLDTVIKNDAEFRKQVQSETAVLRNQISDLIATANDIKQTLQRNAQTNAGQGNRGGSNLEARLLNNLAEENTRGFQDLGQFLGRIIRAQTNHIREIKAANEGGFRSLLRMLNDINANILSTSQQQIRQQQTTAQEAATTQPPSTTTRQTTQHENVTQPQQPSIRTRGNTLEDVLQDFITAGYYQRDILDRIEHDYERVAQEAEKSIRESSSQLTKKVKEDTKAIKALAQQAAAGHIRRNAAEYAAQAGGPMRGGGRLGGMGELGGLGDAIGGSIENIKSFIHWGSVIKVAQTAAETITEQMRARTLMSGFSKSAEAARAMADNLLDAYANSKMVAETGESWREIQENIVVLLKKGIKHQKDMDTVLKTGLKLGHALGVDASRTVEIFGKWKIALRMTNRQIKAASLNLSLFAKSASISGDMLVEVIESTQEINQVFSDMVGPSARIAANVAEMAAYSKRFGLESGIESMLKATASFNSFMENSQEQQFLMMHAWELAGRQWQDLWSGTAMKDMSKFSKSMAEGYAGIIKELEAVEMRYGRAYANWYAETLYGKGMARMKREQKAFLELAFTPTQKMARLQQIQGLPKEQQAEALTRLKVELPGLYKDLMALNKPLTEAIRDQVKFLKQQQTAKGLSAISDVMKQLETQLTDNKISFDDMNKSLTKAMQEQGIDLKSLYEETNKRLKAAGKEQIELSPDWASNYRNQTSAIEKVQAALMSLESVQREQTDPIAAGIKSANEISAARNDILRQWSDKIMNVIPQCLIDLGFKVEAIWQVIAAGIFLDKALNKGLSKIGSKIGSKLFGKTAGRVAAGGVTVAETATTGGFFGKIGGFFGKIGGFFGGLFKNIGNLLTKIPMLGKGFGFLGKAFGFVFKGLKWFGKLFPPIRIIEGLVVSIIGAFQSWGAAMEITGKKTVDIVDKITSAIVGGLSNILNFMTFGLLYKWIGPKGKMVKIIAQWLNKHLGWLRKLLGLKDYSEKGLIQQTGVAKTSKVEADYLKAYYRERLKEAKKQGLSEEEAQKQAYQQALKARKTGTFAEWIRTEEAKTAVKTVRQPAAQTTEEAKTAVKAVRQPAAQTTETTVPELETGGLVKKGGLAYLHDNEVVVPIKPANKTEIGGSQLTNAIGNEPDNVGGQIDNTSGILSDINKNTADSVSALLELIGIIKSAQLKTIPAGSDKARIPSISKSIQHQTKISNMDNWIASDPFGGAIMGGASASGG